MRNSLPKYAISPRVISRDFMIQHTAAV